MSDTRASYAVRGITFLKNWAAMAETAPERPYKQASAVVGGGLVGTLGGLIGLGGAEFRLPLLIGFYRFAALEAVILNKAMSLVVVAFALPFRTQAVPIADVLANWPVILNLLAGSILGAWCGASWATRMRSEALYRVIAVLLVCMALVLLTSNHSESQHAMLTPGALQVAGGVIAGFLIGVVAAVMGVAGGELLIPTLTLVFGVDLKLAGSLSLAISLPTMLTAFARYSRDRSFTVLIRHRAFAAMMAVGSILGAYLGGRLLGIVPTTVLLPLLAAILVVSAVKVWRHAS
ncbi:sulfite exporter TauE/SafE family protein [Cupriavidus sp. 2TAF22]|uniref:sulfite exporter TauE/SafE family protein n=1 Tax=unclassified Cupriavidus TaxID=2640874 RepID=UPI003F91CE59